MAFYMYKARQKQKPNKAFKSDSQRLALSLRSSIAKRRSHLNAALYFRVTSRITMLVCSLNLLGSLFCQSSSQRLSYGKNRLL
ncbi:hypothetical protein THF1C08_170007 [Vibrio jasicida]|uniref:Uncharacterized protein n=1 Tax=Vibrio jasicida TaxID=766224 RepID=A0AAU9QKQ5_9VIBR|nr:hypothetical protein THF1C08_170007 [Vibrio jasicida]CAH1579600.1 hypothetical protein THF1A12_160007 [Vibrio jasicida]